jgi:hypothetical protein
MEKVFCNNCNLGYKDVFSQESNQAFGCASDVVVHNEQRYIYSHYGSEYDTLKHIVSESSEIKLGVICDCCISNSLRNNEIIEDTNFNYWDNIPNVGSEFPNDDDLTEV